MRSKTEIKKEIAALRKLKPVGPFGFKTARTIVAAIGELEYGHDMTAAEWFEMPEHERAMAEQAKEWKEGHIEERPSEGWGKVVK